MRFSLERADGALLRAYLIAATLYRPLDRRFLTLLCGNYCVP
jgi:hypothetical protein